jgi:uncharacterized protein (TIGR02266 family)
VPTSRNSRKHSRLPLEADVEVGNVFQDGELIFESQNVSQGGLFLKSEYLLEVGEVVWISFTLPGTPIAIRTRGEIVWVNRNPDENDPTDRPGMGIKFLDLKESEIEALNVYLSNQ